MGVVILALLLAMGWGALHSLSPGHGKTMVAAYLVGTRGTARHALLLGLFVTVTHTIGVLALGLVTLFASRYILPETLYPWINLDRRARRGGHRRLGGVAPPARHAPASRA